MTERKFDSITVGQLKKELESWPDDMLVGTWVPARDHVMTNLAYTVNLHHIDAVHVAWSQQHQTFKIPLKRHLDIETAQKILIIGCSDAVTEDEW